MLRENNSYSNYVKFTAGRESSLADKSIRGESNLACACTLNATVSDPQGYNYQYAISMPRNTGYKIASHMRGEGAMSVSSQVVYEESISTFSGAGSIVANMSTAEAMGALLSGAGLFNSSAYVKEVLSAILDAGSRPSALDIAQEIWQSQTSQYNTAGTMGNKVNSAGSGGNPWTSLVEGNISTLEALRIILSILVGKTTIVKSTSNNTATVTFRNASGTKAKIIANMTGSERNNVIISPD
jgi:hypothetical protein